MFRKQLPLPGGVLSGGLVRGTGAGGVVHCLLFFTAGGLQCFFGDFQVCFGNRLIGQGGRGRVVHCPAHRAGHPLVQVAGQKPGPAVIQAAAQPGGIGLGLLEGFLLFQIVLLCSVQVFGGGPLLPGGGLPVGQGLLNTRQICMTPKLIF